MIFFDRIILRVILLFRNLRMRSNIPPFLLVAPSPSPSTLPLLRVLTLGLRVRLPWGLLLFLGSFALRVGGDRMVHILVRSFLSGEHIEVGVRLDIRDLGSMHGVKDQHLRDKVSSFWRDGLIKFWFF